jgi:hypothetical protein
MRQEFWRTGSVCLFTEVALVAHHMSRRHRLLGAFVRVEMEERGVPTSGRSDRPEQGPSGSQPGATEQTPGEDGDVQEDRSA